MAHSQSPAVINLPSVATVSAIVSEPRFVFALAVAVVAGAVRGFSGFGSALIYMPLISAVYDPRAAAASLLLIDTICSLPFAVKAMPQCNWREVRPVSIASAIALPIGATALVLIDPLTLRWFIALLVLIALLAIVAGWRYRGRPTTIASLVAGALAGFGGGAVQIGAPPLLVFWLGGDNNAATVRANIMVVFIWQGLLSAAIYWYSGIFTAQAAGLALLLGLPFAAALAIGAVWFNGTSDALYRRVAYLIIAFAGLASLPVFDGLR
jgi:uncharacterized membrane protein YfcA